MEQDFLEERKYLQAKKRVEKIKGFYWHFISYVVVNIFVSSIIIFGIMKDSGASFVDVIQEFAVYSVWIFWGIGLFFHWLSIFGSSWILGKNWEEKKIKEFMDKN